MEEGSVLLCLVALEGTARDWEGKLLKSKLWLIPEAVCEQRLPPPEVVGSSSRDLGGHLWWFM